ncbi:NADH-quinone oxidoreductase subunit NuoH [Hyphomonas oceanitis]|uniref:NADH-quinone oxidoreductase subunit H n=1 Tax=Hyphomonas oceanitis SCH89 TaxID=1280953 RepID=A0A059G4P5_9PROT|nr:NADH-quinone oxidoreductase subunit NuoH [Hyphomonas oceanitis]KDA01555.1 NADH dehydrogenase subunit H [Hyphomonas oceanitis SCH89]
MSNLIESFGDFTGFWMVLGQIALFTLVLLISIAFLLLLDRKIWAGVMMRKGPNVVGPFGLFQSFADFGKFLLKEIVIPAGANKTVFILAPILTCTLSFVAWAAIPVAPGTTSGTSWVVSNLNVGVLYLFAISSLGVYGIIMGGWASNSKYPFLGALRSAAQMVSYEVSIGFIIVTVILLTGSMNLSAIVENQSGGFWNWHIFSFQYFPMIFVMFPMFVMFFISALAETNRPPFDLPEAESELVAGYQVEYGSTPYLLFMLGEYLNIVLMCAMMTIMFLGGWHGPFDLGDVVKDWPPLLLSLSGLFWFMLKILFFFFMFAMVKAIVPRYRYDQLMRLGWKIFLPTSLAAVLIVAGYVVYTGVQA